MSARIEFLSDEWVVALGEALAQRAEPVGSVSGVIQCTVAGVPVRKKVAFAITVASGRVIGASPGLAADATCALSWDLDVARSELAGGLDPDLSFMAGTKKVEGNYAAYLFELQHLLGDTTARAALAELALRTN